jgi:hypothetical protein
MADEEEDHSEDVPGALPFTTNIPKNVQGLSPEEEIPMTGGKFSMPQAPGRPLGPLEPEYGMVPPQANEPLNRPAGELPEERFEFEGRKPEGSTKASYQPGQESTDLLTPPDPMKGFFDEQYSGFTMPVMEDPAEREARSTARAMGYNVPEQAKTEGSGVGTGLVNMAVGMGRVARDVMIPGAQESEIDFVKGLFEQAYSGFTIISDVMSQKTPLRTAEGQLNTEVIDRGMDLAMSLPLASGLIEGGAGIAANPRNSAMPLLALMGKKVGKAAAEEVAAPKPAEPFYSAAEKAVEASKQNKASGDQWAATLKNTPGIKIEELEWTGLDEFLKTPGAKTKEEVLHHLKTHAVEVEEKVFGPPEPKPEAPKKARKRDNSPATEIEKATVADRARNDWRNLEDELADAFGEGSRLEVNRRAPYAANLIDRILARPEHTPQYMRDAAIEEAAIALRAANWVRKGKAAKAEAKGLKTHHERWTEPGGKNYREFMLKLPRKKMQKPSDAIIAKIGDGTATPAERAEFEAARSEASSFRVSGHLGGEENILAHVRFKDRVGAQGKKTLAIEEIQSDWHQKGRERGYKTGKKAEAINFGEWMRRRGVEDVEREIQLNWAAREESPLWREWDKENRAALEAMSEEAQGVPDAPFKQTEAWAGLALKRMIRWAAEHGYDQITWFPGKVQNKRYNLSTHVEAINYSRYPEKGTVKIMAWKKGHTMDGNNPWGADHEMEVPVAELSEQVGKEMADKIMNAEQITGTFKGVDLDIGGSGMKGFYDKMLVDVANKLGKKHGAKVGVTKINNPSSRTTGHYDVDAGAYVMPEDVGGGQEVWSLPITDELRKKAMGEGFALFANKSKIATAISAGIAASKERAMAKSSGNAGEMLKAALKARAQQMDLPPKDRIKPKNVEQVPIKEYQRTQIEGEDLSSLYPRLERDEYLKPDKKGKVRKIARIVPLIDNKMEIAKKLADRMEVERGQATQYFYHTGLLGEAAQALGFTPEYVTKWMDEFARMYAAFSPRTATDQNLRNATLAMAKRQAGAELTDVMGPGTGGVSEKGFPMMIDKGGIHKKLHDASSSPEGIDRMTNPKPWFFSKNVAGNLTGVTADTHAIRAALDVLNELKPGTIGEWIKPEFKEKYAADPSKLDPATWIDDTLGSVSVKGKQMQVEYGPIADIYHEAAKILGVQPAEAQSMGWFASGKRTGLKSDRKTVVDLVNERINVTAQALEISEKEAAKKLLNREIPLLVNPAEAGAVGAVTAEKRGKKNGRH